MLPSYNDIRSRIAAWPLWYDGNGVPRYDPFTPDMLGVYDHYAVFVRIQCQSCGNEFFVGEGYQSVTFRRLGEEIIVKENTLEKITERYHYGDPPSHGCIGDTMNCIDLSVVEAWERMPAADWTRRPELEKEIP